MKVFVIFLVLIVFSIGVLFSMENSYAMPPFSSQEVFDFSEIIAVGKVVYVNSTFSPTMNLYSIDVEKYLKNPQDSDVILAAGAKTISIRAGNQVFDTGDRALFFLTNSSVGYDVHSAILNVHPVSKK